MTLLEDIARGIARSALMNRAERGDFNIDEAVNEFWPTYEPDARAALAAIEASGHVVLPKEPTPEMMGAIDAIGSSLSKIRDMAPSFREVCADVYAAMLSARPKAS